MNRIIFLLGLWLPLASYAALVDSGNVKAELVSEVDAVVPGETFHVALRQIIREGWHTYWRNPGDSGAPTELVWDLPAGFEAGEMQWPWPERVPYGPLVNYGYHGEVLFPVEIRAPSDITGDRVTLRAKGQWLVCADICIPEDAELEITLPVKSSAGPNRDVADDFIKAWQRIPADIGVTARYRTEGDALLLRVALEGIESARIESATFFPYQEGVIDNAAPQDFRIAGGALEIELIKGFDFDEEASLDGIVVVTEDSGERLASAFVVSPTERLAAPAEQAAGLGLGTALLFAFLGGLILNLMPCVFPVLSIKVLSLMQQVGTHGREIRVHGWVYLGGVVASFIAIAAVLIVLRAGGAQIGWGFQLQSPIVVGLLVYLFFLIGMSLAGYFEIGGSLMNLGEGLASRAGLSGSFLTGVLATVVAAPCTAPFMASAVGFALTQSNLVALSIFGALGLGMATPYVVLCYSPALLDRLPRPGTWMVRFKELLSFPMFASAIWLVWVLDQQSGEDGVLAVLTGILLLAFAIWLLKVLRRREVAIVLSLPLFAVALYLPGLVQVSDQSARDNGAVIAGAGYEGPAWETWSPEKQARLRARGPLFVNFTAAWCITCKVNEAVALDSVAVRSAFEAHGVRYLKGDWTNEDPAITAALAEYDRSGVPLYLLYSPGEPRARVLPQVLTESIVLRALESL